MYIPSVKSEYLVMRVLFGNVPFFKDKFAYVNDRGAFVKFLYHSLLNLCRLHHFF